MRTAIACSLAVFALSGCFYQNMSPATKLRDAVEANNEGARWGRMDIARERVAPEYARDYARRHYDWGDGIQLADLDILSLQMDSESEHATVVVAFGWYAYDNMSLERTVVQQLWKSGSGGFMLISEEVIDGEARLLEPEEEDDADEEVDDEEDEEELADRDDEDDEEEDDDEGWIDAEGEEAEESPALASAI